MQTITQMLQEGPDSPFSQFIVNCVEGLEVISATGTADLDEFQQIIAQRMDTPATPNEDRRRYGRIMVRIAEEWAHRMGRQETSTKRDALVEGLGMSPAEASAFLVDAGESPDDLA
jgi:hypothetical protein